MKSIETKSQRAPCDCPARVCKKKKRGEKRKKRDLNGAQEEKKKKKKEKKRQKERKTGSFLLCGSDLRL